MKTAALAAFIQGRNMRFAGAPVTLAKILKMWQLPYDGVSATIDGAALEGVARYCKLSVTELTAAVEAMRPAAPAPKSLPLPPPAPVPIATFAAVQIPPVVAQNPPAPTPAPEPPPVVIESSKPPAPDPTSVIPQEQLSDLVAASRRSSPAITTPEPLAGPEDDDNEVEISFDEVEATPIPETPEAASASAPMSDAAAAKSKKKRKKKS